MRRVLTFGFMLLLLVLLKPAPAASLAEPLIITSAGQSSDILLTRQFFMRAGLAEPLIDAKLVADSLQNVETLVIVVGGSVKGLGQASDAGDLEQQRVNELLDKAENDHIQVLCLHVGREGRRGPLSDRFIEPVARRATRTLVLEGGNADGLFSDIATETGIPLIEVVDYKECVTQINALFGWELPDR